MRAAALLALLATAAADRPLVVATRPADATSSLPVLLTSTSSSSSVGQDMALIRLACVIPATRRGQGSAWPEW